MVYEAIFRGLNGAGTRYLIVGAVAVNLHGIPRMTADLDVMVDLAEPNLRSFVDTMAALGYRPRAPVSAAALLDAAARRAWRETKDMVMFTWIHPDRPYEEVDLFLENPIDFAPAYARRVDVAAGNLSLPIACIQDLIALKRLAGRAQDRSDIAALMQLQRLADEGKA
jgi:hypothetical protein